MVDAIPWSVKRANTDVKNTDRRVLLQQEREKENTTWEKPTCIWTFWEKELKITLPITLVAIFHCDPLP